MKYQNYLDFVEKMKLKFINDMLVLKIINIICEKFGVLFYV